MADTKDSKSKGAEVFERVVQSLNAAVPIVRARPDLAMGVLGYAFARAAWEVFGGAGVFGQTPPEAAKPDPGLPRCARCRMALAAYVDEKGDGRGGYQHPYNARCGLSGAEVAEGSPDLAWTL